MDFFRNKLHSSEVRNGARRWDIASKKGLIFHGVIGSPRFRLKCCRAWFREALSGPPNVFEFPNVLRRIVEKGTTKGLRDQTNSPPCGDQVDPLCGEPLSMGGFSTQHSGREHSKIWHCLFATDVREGPRSCSLHHVEPVFSARPASPRCDA